MEKIWLKSYPKDIPAEIDPDDYRSVVEIFEETCRKYKKKPAFQNLGSTLSYEQLDKLTRDFAAFLQNRLGLERGSRVAIMMPNLLQYPVSMFGILRAGMIVTNVNPLYTHRELVHQINDAGAEVIIVLESFAPVVEKALPDMETVKYVIVTKPGDLFSAMKGAVINFIVRHIKKMVHPWKLQKVIWFKDVLEEGVEEDLTNPKLRHHDLAFLQYTGGTTGVSKGAMLTHGNMVANILQLHAWVKPYFREGREIVITALPLYHIFSLTANCMLFMTLGSLNVLITNPRNVLSLIRQIKLIKFSAITGVNTLFNGLVSHSERRSIDFSNLRLTLGGGMAVQSSVAQRWYEATECVLLEAYGLTEASPAVCINPLDITAFNGTSGLPISSTEVSIRDKDGDELPVGTAGELCIRGPQVMSGYWHQQEETEMVLSPDGWLKTGDIASINEEGYVTIRERSKDMIIVSGFNVYPNELESVIAEMEDVLEVAVIGVPHPVSGEAPKAFIVTKNAELTERDVKNYCRTKLTNYKIPRKVVFRNELPKSSVGKILRRKLREDEEG